MAEFTKNLHFLKDGTEQTAKAYSTTAEAGSNYVMATIDSTSAYIPIGDETDSRATNGRVIKSGTTYAILNSGKPPYAEQSWTTAGTYTFTVPASVTRIRVAVCGGGGGVAYCGDTDADDRLYTAGTGGTSSFGSLISATGGTGGSFKMIGHSVDGDANWYDYLGSGGSGGSPNGKAGNFVHQNAFGYNQTLTSTGGTGFALSFTNVDTSDGYGNGGYATLYGCSYFVYYTGVANAAGGSGGYNTGYVDVTAGSTYSVTVGGSGTNSLGNVEGDCSGTPTDAKSGFVLIAYGGDI